jgi:hypothetical protein
MMEVVSTSETSVNFCDTKKEDGKAVPQHIYGGKGGQSYSSYSFTTSALDGG